MRKSTIWLLAVVMAFAFAGLLYLQVNYVSIILKHAANSSMRLSKEACAKYLRIWNWMRPVNTSRMISTGMRQISCIKMPRMPQSLGQVINHEKYQLQIKDSNGTVQQIDAKV